MATHLVKGMGSKALKELGNLVITELARGMDSQLQTVINYL
jgi:hypothetical protein